MNIEPLSKKETKELEHTSTPIQNLFHSAKLLPSDCLILSELGMELQGWYHTWGLQANIRISSHWKKMSELLGIKPTYYCDYEYRTAVYGFLWNGHKVILYLSMRGLSLQVSPKFRKDKIKELYTDFIDTLVCKKFY